VWMPYHSCFGAILKRRSQTIMRMTSTFFHSWKPKYKGLGYLKTNNCLNATETKSEGSFSLLLNAGAE